MLVNANIDVLVHLLCSAGQCVMLANNPIQLSEQCNHSATAHSATHHSATIRQEWSKKCNHSRSRNRQLWWRQVNRTLLSGLRATLVLPNPTLVNFYFWFGHCLGEPVKKDLLQFYFFPYIDDYDPTTPILYNVHTYV